MTESYIAPQLNLDDFTQIFREAKKISEDCLSVPDIQQNKQTTERTQLDATQDITTPSLVVKRKRGRPRKNLGAGDLSECAISSSQQ